VAAIIAVAVNTDGPREIVGLGPSEAEAFWTEFLRGLQTCGRGELKPVISDPHTGPEAAVWMKKDLAGELPDTDGLMALTAQDKKVRQGRLTSILARRPSTSIGHTSCTPPPHSTAKGAQNAHPTRLPPINHKPAHRAS